MSKKMKKLLILNIPYLVLGLLFTKLPEAWRHTNGVDLGQKILNLGEGLSRAFAVPFPSFYSTDLLIGLAIGALLKLIIYIRSKNAKKYRKGVEYGSARWGNAKDIELELSIIVQSVNPQNYSRQPLTYFSPSAFGMLPEEDRPDLKCIF